MALDLPAPVAAKARLIGADAWLAGLDELVAGLAAAWSLTTGPAHHRATEALVLDAVRADGTPAVLKIMLPVPQQIHGELLVLGLAGGAGCVRLLEADEVRGAVLLERLGPALGDAGLPLVRRDEILIDLAARVWRHAPDTGVKSGADKARALAAFVERAWRDSGEACAERTVEHALACVRRRGAAHRDERALLCHGDVHPWNALQAGDGWALVDPDGLLAEPEYDLGVILREDSIESLGEGMQHRARRLAARAGRDPVATWEWGVVERVSTGLLCTLIDAQPVGREMLEVADLLAALPLAERDVTST